MAKRLDRCAERRHHGIEGVLLGECRLKTERHLIERRNPMWKVLTLFAFLTFPLTASAQPFAKENKKLLDWPLRHVQKNLFYTVEDEEEKEVTDVFWVNMNGHSYRIGYVVSQETYRTTGCGIVIIGNSHYRTFEDEMCDGVFDKAYGYVGDEPPKEEKDFTEVSLRSSKEMNELLEALREAYYAAAAADNDNPGSGFYFKDQKYFTSSAHTMVDIVLMAEEMIGRKNIDISLRYETGERTMQFEVIFDKRARVYADCTLYMKRKQPDRPGITFLDQGCNGSFEAHNNVGGNHFEFDDDGGLFVARQMDDLLKDFKRFVGADQKLRQIDWLP